MTKALVIAEINNHELNPGTYRVITAASRLTQDVVVLLIGYEVSKIADDLTAVERVKQVLVADHSTYKDQLAENMAQLIAGQAQAYDYVLAAATSFGKNLLPRVAALLNVTQLSDVVEIVNADTFVRPIYAGNAFATLRILDKIKVMTVRTMHFAPVKHAGNKASINKIDAAIENTQTKLVERQLSQSKRPDLAQAKIIIAGGRGLQSAEQFKQIEKIADLLNAAIGASRAAVDAGYIANEYQVGQTGKMVAPELYIAIGISGAIQHLAGMKDSKVIVAINKDADAPIFQVANYGLVADFFKILPELEKELLSLM